jgi:hypothetical protein
MKGINFITDNNDRKTAVVIDLKTIEKFDEQIEDLFDIIIAESRKGEPTTPWETVKAKIMKNHKN